MKLLELDLHAYGPFSRTRLELSDGDEGLHIIYGPNEAGKSSALRALHALLYGIPERTTDDFIHDKQALRVGGRLRGADGTELVVYRRKGRKNTLLTDIEGDSLDDNVMRRMLAGVDEPLFETLFGINHAVLVKGGETLLLEHGREAEALFGSGLGSTAVHTLLESFESRAKDLFAPQASKPQINQLLRQLKDTQAALRDVSLSARQWDEARKAMNRALAELSDIETRITEESRRRSFLERARRTLPNLAKRHERQKRLSELQQVPQLLERFAADCTEAMDTRTRATDDLRKAEARIKGLKEQIEKIVFSTDLIEKAEQIDDLRERLGSYRKANSDLPKLSARLSDRRSAATEKLSLIRPDLTINDISDLRSAVARRRRLTELSARRDSLVAGVTSAEKALNKAELDLRKQAEELAHLDDIDEPAGVRSAVNRARALGDIDTDIITEQLRLEEEYNKSQARLDALDLWTAGLQALLSAPLPSLEMIQTHVDIAVELKDEQDTALRDRKAADNEIKQVEEILRRLELMGDVPTEAELQQVRGKRDAVWQLLRKKWLDGADVESESETFGGIDHLPQEFESSMEASDETADRLRREAQRVHEDATARARREICRSVIEEIDSTLVANGKRQNEVSNEWAQLWSATNISPRAPKEMAAWLLGVTRIRDRLGEIEDQNAQLNTTIARRNEAARYLIENLETVGGGTTTFHEDRLRPVLMAAEHRLAEIEASSQRKAQLGSACSELRQQISELENDLGGAKENLDKWKVEWHKAMSLLGLDKESTTGELLDYLDVCDSIVTVLDEAAELGQRITAINSDNEQFDSEVHDLLNAVASDLSKDSVAEAISKLAARLTDCRTAATRYQGLSEQLDKAKEEHSEAEATIAASNEQLESLCKLARCEKPEDLSSVSRQAEERDQLASEIKDLEAELLEGGDGLSITELEEEVADVDRDQLASELQRISERLDKELRPKQRDLIEQKTEAERRFSEMAGTDDAARLADEAQQIMSELRTLAAQYTQTKIASRILRDEVERYRQEHRSPILMKGSHYFARLTCDAYKEIATSFDQSDLPVLVGVRADGERKRVEQMSDGTRDQLYLALRLATLEHYAGSSDALPFIVDDILIQFDDSRSESTLTTLAEFSGHTQVILFTHHLHVVDQANRLASKQNGVFIHKLVHVGATGLYEVLKS